LLLLENGPEELHLLFGQTPGKSRLDRLLEWIP